MAFSTSFTFKGIDQYSSVMKSIVAATSAYQTVLKSINGMLGTNRTRTDDMAKAMASLTDPTNRATGALTGYAEALKAACGASELLQAGTRSLIRDLEVVARMKTGYMPNFTRPSSGVAETYAAAKASTGLVRYYDPYQQNFRSSYNGAATSYAVGRSNAGREMVLYSPFGKGQNFSRVNPQAASGNYSPNFTLPNMGPSGSYSYAASGSTALTLYNKNAGLARAAAGAYAGTSMVHYGAGGGTYNTIFPTAPVQDFDGRAPYLSKHTAYRGGMNIGILGAVGLGAGGYILKQGMDFENELAQIHKTIGDAPRSLETMKIAKKEILNMANRIPVSRTEIAASWAEVARHKITQAKPLQQYSMIGLQAATDWDMSAVDATKDVMTIRNAYNLNPANTRKYMDRINTMHNQGGAAGSAIMQNLKSLSGIAGIQHIPADKLIGIISTDIMLNGRENSAASNLVKLMTQVGVAGNFKNDKLRAFMTPFANGKHLSGAQTKTIIRQFNKDYEKDSFGTTLKFFDKASKLDPAVERAVYAGILGKAGLNTSNIQNLLSTSNRAALLDNISKSSFSNKKADGSLEREAAIRWDTTSNALHSIRNIIQTFFTSIGDTLLKNEHVKKSLQDFATNLREATEKIADIFNRHPRMVGWLFKLGMGLSALAVGVGVLAGAAHFFAPIMALAGFPIGSMMYNGAKAKAFAGGAGQTAASLASEGSGVFGSIVRGRAAWGSAIAKGGGGLRGIGAAVKGSWTSLASGGGLLANVAAMLGNPLTKLAGALAWFLTPAGAITAAVLALGAVLLVGYNRCKPFREAVDKLVSYIGFEATVVLGDFFKFLESMLDGLGGMMTSFMDSSWGKAFSDWADNQAASVDAAKGVLAHNAIVNSPFASSLIPSQASNLLTAKAAHDVMVHIDVNDPKGSVAGVRVQGAALHRGTYMDNSGGNDSFRLLTPLEFGTQTWQLFSGQGIKP